MPITKLSNRNTIQVYVKFYKQIDGSTMGDPLSILFSDIHMTKAKQQIVKSLRPKFYKMFVDDIINIRQKVNLMCAFGKLNNDHLSKKYTIEIQTKTFLYIKII